MRSMQDILRDHWALYHVLTKGEMDSFVERHTYHSGPEGSADYQFYICDPFGNVIDGPLVIHTTEEKAKALAEGILSQKADWAMGGHVRCFTRGAMSEYLRLRDDSFFIEDDLLLNKIAKFDKIKNAALGIGRDKAPSPAKDVRMKEEIVREMRRLTKKHALANSTGDLTHLLPESDKTSVEALRELNKKIGDHMKDMRAWRDNVRKNDKKANLHLEAYFRKDGTGTSMHERDEEEERRRQLRVLAEPMTPEEKQKMQRDFNMTNKEADATEEQINRAFAEVAEKDAEEEAAGAPDIPDNTEKRPKNWRRKYIILEVINRGDDKKVITHVARLTHFDSEQQADLFVMGANLAVERHGVEGITYTWAYADNLHIGL